MLLRASNMQFGEDEGEERLNTTACVGSVSSVSARTNVAYVSRVWMRIVVMLLLLL